MIYKAHNFISKCYHYSIALTRRESGSVAMGFAYALLNNVFAFALIAVIMFMLNGVANIAIRGEFGVYILTGVGLFLMHNKIISELSTPFKDRQLMPLLAISPGIVMFGNLLNAVYMQTVMLLLLGVGVWVYYGGFEVEYPVLAFWIFILCIAWSAAIGICLYAIIPVWPAVLQKLVMVYKRLGVVTSGKMVPGNLMQGTFHGLFAWNPLYHCIDQIRGAVFVNYVPFNSNLHYPVWATIYCFCTAILLYVGLARFR